MKYLGNEDDGLKQLAALADVLPRDVEIVHSLFKIADLECL
jgi:hypothetical protein